VRIFAFTHRVALLVVVVAGVLVGAPSRASWSASSPAAFRLVVNPENPTTTVTRRFVAEVFLKKTTRCEDGSLVRPVDLGAESSVRQRFCDEVLGRSLGAVKSYWQQALFAGRDLPPPEVNTDEDVIHYVQKYPGAIGYVSGAADVGRVKLMVLK
jgi:ABC-type phosphate transport system substrate-binding protein